MTIPSVAITRPSGPPGAPLLVLGSSLGTSTILWDTVSPRLRESFRVCTFDLPGHGTSPAASAPFTVGEIALAVLDAVTALDETVFHYAGVSLGGAVGLEAMLAASDRVASAAIVCSGAQIGSREAWLDRAVLVRTRGTAALVGDAAGRWFAPGSIERIPVVSGRLLHDLADTDDESYALCTEALASYTVRPLLANITAPVLALWGDHDPVVGREDAEEIASGVGDGRAVMVAEAAHLAPADQPEAVASALLRFFEAAR